MICCPTETAIAAGVIAAEWVAGSKTVDTDIELAVTGLSMDQCEPLIRQIPRGYTVEDRTSTRYGVVVRSESSGDDSNDLTSSKLENFLSPLLPLAEAIRDRDCVVRVAVFSSGAYTKTTFSFSCLDVVRKFNARLEVSVYPVDEAG